MRTWLIVIALASHVLAACSSYMAVTGNEKRDMGILSPGTSRDIVLSEFGTPLTSVEAEGEHYDIFRFVQGRSDGSNAGRAVVYGAAAVFTLGLSEVLFTPLEMAVGDQGEVKLRVHYDDQDRVRTAEALDGNEWVSLAEFEAATRARAQAAAEKNAAQY